MAIRSRRLMKVSRSHSLPENPPIGAARIRRDHDLPPVTSDQD